MFRFLLILSFIVAPVHNKAQPVVYMLKYGDGLNGSIKQIIDIQTFKYESGRVDTQSVDTLNFSKGRLITMISHYLKDSVRHLRTYTYHSFPDSIVVDCFDNGRKESVYMLDSLGRELQAKFFNADINRNFQVRNLYYEKDNFIQTAFSKEKVLSKNYYWFNKKLLIGEDLYHPDGTLNFKIKCTYHNFDNHKNWTQKKVQVTNSLGKFDLTGIYNRRIIYEN